MYHFNKSIVKSRDFPVAVEERVPEERRRARVIIRALVIDLGRKLTFKGKKNSPLGDDAINIVANAFVINSLPN